MPTDMTHQAMPAAAAGGRRPRDHRTPERFPRSALIGAGLVIAFSLVVTAIGSWTDWGTVRMPDVAAVSQRTLAFEDRDGGRITITDHDTGATVAVIDPATNGFLRGVMRGLARERMLNGIGAEPPFVVTRWADGRLSLSDPSTEREIHLDAFGPDNAGVFARMLGPQPDGEIVQ